MGELIRVLAAEGMVKMSVVESRDIAERARQIHDLSPLATAALGRTLTAASILGNFLKDDGTSVTLRLNGKGPLGTILTVADNLGNVRGYVQNPQVDLPLRPDGKLDVGGGVGTDGMLTVIRDLNMREPYVGSVPLVSGEIAEDMTKYFADSEQTASACALGVLVDVDRTVLASGGYLVQLLPGAPDEICDRLEENIRRTGSVTGVLNGGTPEDLIRGVLEGLDPRIVERDPVEYRCYCSRQRVEAALAGIGDKELAEMEAEGKPLEVTCQFCDKVYRFDLEEIRALRRRGREGTE